MTVIKVYGDYRYKPTRYQDGNAHKMNLNDAIHMAVKLANQGMLDQAEEACRDILTANDKYHPAYHLLGQLAFQQGKDQIAVQMTHKAVLLDGTRAIYHRDLAEILCICGKPADALQVIKRAVALNPNDPKSHYVAGMALTAIGDHDKAVQAYQTTIKLSPDHGRAYNNLGAVLEMTGRAAEAKKAYTKAIKINKNHAEAQNNLATILVAEGDIPNAKKHFEAAIKARPNYIEAHHNLSALKRYKKNDEHFRQLSAMAENVSNLPFANQVRLYFTLGKAYADIGKYDTAFDFYRLGNKTMRSGIQYDEKEAVKIIEDIKTAFDKKNFKNNKISKNDDPTPIFIVGMPRSGSTLIEQILCGHSDVYGGGELSILTDIVKAKIKNFPQGVEALSAGALKEIGDEYLLRIKELHPTAKRIVDKMPANYHYAGLIAKILPGAHIINSCRNPMDSCFSNYTRLFLYTISYAYDLGELGRYYNRYQDLMKHWHRVLPKGTLLDIHYEDVVANLEEEARKMIGFVGLEWEDRCLRFHKNRGPVRTASAAQVRKPIYNTSLQKWRPYEKHLGPLIEALKDDTPDADL